MTWLITRAVIRQHSSLGKVSVQKFKTWGGGGEGEGEDAMKSQ